jgi:exonuclease VII small subunit
MAEQIAFGDEGDEADLEAAVRLANWRAFMAPVAEDAGAVARHPEVARLAVAILNVFAEHSGSQGLTRAEVLETLVGNAQGWSQDLVSRRLGVLTQLGFLEPYILKSHHDRYVVRPAGLAGALAAERLAEHGGVDELILLLDRARSVFDRSRPDPDAALDYLVSCRNALRVFALDLQRQVAIGTPAELMQSQRQHDHQGFTRQVADLNKLVTERFRGQWALEEAAAALIEAEQFYRQQLMAAADKVVEQAGDSLNFDVLTVAEYTDAAFKGDVALLSRVGGALVADMPAVWIETSSLFETVEGFAPRSRVRVRPPLPDDDSDGEGDGALRRAEEAYERARVRRRLLADELLAGAEEADLTAALYEAGWPLAAAIIADVLALGDDPAEPYTVTVQDGLLADPQASVTYLHSLRLRRTSSPSHPASTGRDV